MPLKLTSGNAAVFRAFAADVCAGAREIRAIYPGQRQRLHVRRIDLLERAVVTAGIIAVIGGPRVDRRLEQQRRIERALRQRWEQAESHD